MHEHLYPLIAALGAGVHRPRFKLTRDLTMFGLGAATFAYETLRGGDRPNILYGSLALMGVAAYLRGMNAKDESRD